MLLHCLEATGPANVIVSTWTAAGADIERAYSLLGSGLIRTLQFVVDFSFPSRQPAYCEALRERFGDGAIRVCKNHAKFCRVRNETWNLVIRTSMNLNENQRLESFEISDDAALAGYLAGVVGELFEFQAASEGFSKRPIEIVRDFEGFAQHDAAPPEADLAKSADTKKYFGDGPFDNHLRRAGLSYVKGE